MEPVNADVQVQLVDHDDFAGRPALLLAASDHDALPYLDAPVDERVVVLNGGDDTVSRVLETGAVPARLIRRDAWPCRTPTSRGRSRTAGIGRRAEEHAATRTIRRRRPHLAEGNAVTASVDAATRARHPSDVSQWPDAP